MVLLPQQSNIQIPGLFSITPQRVLVATLALLYIMLIGDRNPESTTPLKILLILHLSWCALSTSMSVVPVVSIKKMLMVVLEYYLVYYIVVRSITTKETINKLLYAMVASITVCCVFAVVTVYLGWDVMTLLPTGTPEYFAEDTVTGRGGRVMATFPHPILFGAAIVTVLPASLYLLQDAHGKRAKFLWLGLLLMFASVYKTLSRGPWIGAGMTLGILFPFVNARMRGILAKIGFLVFLTLVVRPGVWATVRDTFQATFMPDTGLNASYEYRYALWNVATSTLNSHLDRAVWGFGLESFRQLGLRGMFQGDPAHLFLSCDSAWIEFMMETGYVGFLIIALVLGTPALSSMKAYLLSDRPRDALPMVTFSALIANFFMMISVALYAWGQNGYMIWLLIAIAMAHKRLQCVTPRETSFRPLNKMAQVKVESKTEKDGM